MIDKTFEKSDEEYSHSVDEQNWAVHDNFLKTQLWKFMLQRARERNSTNPAEDARKEIEEHYRAGMAGMIPPHLKSPHNKYNKSPKQPSTDSSARDPMIIQREECTLGSENSSTVNFKRNEDGDDATAL